MKTIITITFYFFTLAMLSAQVVADFEGFGLSAGEKIDQDLTGLGFLTGEVSLQNEYNQNYASWSGWAISADTDTTTAGFANQYSSIVGSGYDGSTTYGVAYEFGINYIDIVDNGATNLGTFDGMYISNCVYPYLSMLEGDAFAKKFGGETGEDPDFFSIVFRGEVDGVTSADSVEFFLADFRSSDSSEDYILKDWSWVDLTSLGEVDGLSITMRSSDVGSFGINTPLYFCVDNITVTRETVSTSSVQSLDMDIYPNLVDQQVNVKLLSSDLAQVKVFSLLGAQVAETSFFGGSTILNLGDLPNGHYIISIQQNGAIGSSKIMKH